MPQFSTQGTAATVGLFTAPLVPTIAPAFYAGTSSPGVVSAFYGAFLIYVVSLLLGGLFGLPLFYLLARIRLVKLWACLLGGFLGAMAQSNVDESAEQAPIESDRKTAEYLGQRVAELTHRVTFVPQAA